MCATHVVLSTHFALLQPGSACPLHPLAAYYFQSGLS